MAYHPTTIRLHSEHCPHAVQLWKKGEKYDRSIFHTGVVAHAVLEKIGQIPEENPQKLADKIVETYCSKGRAYDNVPEPPAPLHQAIEGARLALEYHHRHPVPHGEGITHEHPFAFDKDWNPVKYYSKKAKFRTLLDVVEISEEYDEYAQKNITIATIRDYKSSWVANRDELDTFQRRCQAVVVWLTYKPDTIILEIANLRTKAIYNKQINANLDHEILHEWKEDIDLAIKTLDGNLQPNPGIGCIKCPYSPRCTHFDNMYKSEDIIKKYIAAKEVIRQLEPQIKLATKDQTPKQMSLGVVGYAAKERKKICPNAKQILLEEFDTNTEDLFQNLDLSVRNIQKLAKLLTKNKTDRDNLIDRLTFSEAYASFGVHKDKK